MKDLFGEKETKKTIEDYNKEYPRRNGWYYLKIDGETRKLPSVTTIINTVLAKPALRYWMAKKAAEIALDNPTLTAEEAIAGTYKIRDTAGNKGSCVHSLIEAYTKEAKIDIAGLPSEVRGYAQAFLSWQEAMKPEFLLTEQVIYSKRYGYAGRLDFTCEIEKKLFLVDIKTGKNLYPIELSLQLSAYKVAVDEMGSAPDLFRSIDQLAGLHLQPDGKYTWMEIENNFEVFLAVKKVWEFLEKK